MLLDYLTYLKIPTLLAAQQFKGEPKEHDEMLFIIVHQSYELWFKQFIHESALLNESLTAANVHLAMKTLIRMEKILQLCIEKVSVLETMTPQSFKNFRAFLETASGFQSYQFRQIEVLFGFFNPIINNIFPKNSIGYKAIQQQLKQETLWEAFCTYLQHHDTKIPTPERKGPVGLIHDRLEKAAQARLAVLVAQSPEVSQMADLLLTLDEKLQEWRYRHMKMVVRTIGNKKGTGGSDGVGYLKKTLDYVAFPSLWALRNEE